MREIDRLKKENAWLRAALKPIIEMDESRFYVPFEYMPRDSFIFGNTCHKAITECRRIYNEGRVEWEEVK